MKKAALSALFIVSLLALALGLSLNKTINAPASFSFVSPEGGYIIESVTVTGLLNPFGGLSYLRIIDRQDPSKVFRTPLYAAGSLDLWRGATESSEYLSVMWVRFDKHEQRFTLGTPEWNSSWRNIFISNTPYEAGGNGTPCIERLSPEERALGFGGEWLSHLKAFTMVTPCSGSE
jgi:hypothetical protein